MKVDSATPVESVRTEVLVRYPPTPLVNFES